MSNFDHGSEGAGCFPCQGFHAGLPGGQAAGTLCLGPGWSGFRWPEGELGFAAAGCAFRMGGNNDAQLFVTHPAHPGWIFCIGDARVFAHPLLRSNEAFNTQRRQGRQRRRLVWGFAALALLLLVALPALLLWNMDRVTALAVERIPPAWERELGEAAFAQYRGDGAKLLDSPEVDRAAADFVAPLAEAAGVGKGGAFPLRVHVADDPQVNAFALPGGIVVLNSGLLQAAEDGGEVSGVVAHEIAHVTARHGLRQAIGSAGVMLLVQTLLGDTSGLAALAANTAPFLLTQGYSRAFEAEADRQGMAYMRSAGVDPEGMLRFFRRLLAREREAGASVGAAGAFLSSHPATEERIAALEKALPPEAPTPFAGGDAAFRNLRGLVQAALGKEQAKGLGDAGGEIQSRPDR